MTQLFYNMDKMENRLNAILPKHDTPISLNIHPESRSDAVKACIKATTAKALAKRLSEQKAREKMRLENLEKAAEKAAGAADIPRLVAAQSAIEGGKKNIDALEKTRAEVIEAAEIADDPLDIRPLAEKSDVITEKMERLLRVQGTGRADIDRLLANLGINLSVRLTKSDTANLLACLLTCNESQLQALMCNAAVPVVIKTVIRRLIDDSRLGNTETIERLWDRVFGKGPMQDSAPDKSAQSGLIPDMPISREAYVIIRDTLMR